MSDMPIELPFTTVETSRHGKIRRYVRLKGKRIRLLHRPGHPDFLDEYRAALTQLRAAMPEPEENTRPSRKSYERGSLGWLIERYFAESPGLRTMSKIGSARRRRILVALAESHGSRPMVMATDAISAGFARRAEKPGAANDWLKTIKALYSWSCAVGITTTNPAAPVRKIKVKTDGFHIWSVEEIRAFAARHTKGSMAYLSLMLFVFTGLRRSDATRLGLQHVKDGVIHYKTGKTGATLVTAYARPFREATEATGRRVALNFLLNAHGQAFASGAAFGNWFKDRCVEAGLPHCSAHGLRKAGASIAADEGASDLMLDAMFGWSEEASGNQSRTYTRAASKARLATEGFALIERALRESGVLTEQNHTVSVAP